MLAVILGIIGDLAKEAFDAYQRSKVDDAALKASLLASMDKARAAIQALPVQLEANDAAADAVADAKPPGGP